MPDGGVQTPKGMLFITLIEAEHVPRVDLLSKTDPFVKCGQHPVPDCFAVQCHDVLQLSQGEMLLSGVCMCLVYAGLGECLRWYLRPAAHLCQLEMHTHVSFA